jgi:hypothetical protein
MFTRKYGSPIPIHPPLLYPPLLASADLVSLLSPPMGNVIDAHFPRIYRFLSFALVQELSGFRG